MTNDDLWHAPISAAGVLIEDAGALVRRHLGLTDPPERWAAPLYDRPPSAAAELSDADLLACGALGVRVTRTVLEAWPAARTVLDGALRGLDPELSLENAADDVLARIHAAVESAPLEASVTTKLLHRVRPRLVPPVDRTIIDWYGRGLDDRAEGRSPRLLVNLRRDLCEPRNRASLVRLQHAIVAEHDGALAPTRLRLFDIAVWMADHRS